MSELKPVTKAIVASCPNPKALHISTIGSIARKKLYQKAKPYLVNTGLVMTPTAYPSSETWVVSDLYDTAEVIQLLTTFIKTI